MELAIANSELKDIPIAAELAKKQRSISVAEFFEKNRHILGFESPARSLITCVKEAVDNSLDACEEAGILPDIWVEIKKIDEKNYRIIVEDNGPGIVRTQIPLVFGKLLYGSRFHTLKQSRGQQGLGISAAVLYAQITSGKPVKIISKIAVDEPAYYFELFINTQKNEPEIVVEKTIEWYQTGTRIELEMEGTYIRGKKSVQEYLKATSIVNPHARIRLIEPNGNEILYERLINELPKQSIEIKPHPHGIDIGTLMKMLQQSRNRKLGTFLVNEFKSIGQHTACNICREAKLDINKPPWEITLEEAKRLLMAFKKVKISSPSLDCLSPITEELIQKSLEREYKPDFIATTTRAGVYAGNPFIVEVGLAYGGSINSTERIEILRFANRVPLLYQQGACAITQAIERINWKYYGLEQANNSSLPSGPFMILIHIASTKVPFTSESKDAIASIPEILEEVELAIRETARKLSNFLARKRQMAEVNKKKNIFLAYNPLLAQALECLTGRPAKDIEKQLLQILDKRYSNLRGGEGE
ncbi:MAG: DNA topoisomerase VI subunit B [Methanocellales archaeon]